MDYNRLAEILRPFVGKLVSIKRYNYNDDKLTAVSAENGVLTLTTRRHLWNTSDYPDILETATFDGRTLLQILLVQPPVPQTKPTERKFVNDLCKLPCDVTLISAEGVRIPSHKAILSARSPVFATMFSTEMKEKKTNEVTFNEHSAGAVKTFWEILYVKPFPALAKHLSEVVQLLEMYEVGSLKSVAGVELKDYVTKENAGELFFQAARNKQPDILKLAYQIILDNKSTIVAGEIWKKMKPEGVYLDETAIDAMFGF